MIPRSFCHFLFGAVMLASVPARAHEGAPTQLQRLAAGVNVNALFERAIDYRNLAHIDDARMVFDLIEAIDPENRRVSFEKGRLELHRGAHSAAVAAFTRFLESGAPTYPALLLRGRARAALGEQTAAIDDFRAAVRLHPGVDAYVHLCRNLRAVGRTADARFTAEEGVDRTNADLLREVAFEAHLADGAPLEAARSLDAILDRARVKTRWLLLRAEAYEAAGELQRAMVDRQAALAEAERLVNKRPSPAALAARARALAALGRTGDAERDRTRALERAPYLRGAR